MDLDALIARVQIKLDDDDSFTVVDITRELNNCLYAVSKRLKLPENDTVEDVTCVAGDISVALPTEYQRGLYKCTNKTTKKNCNIYNSKGQLARYCYGLDNEGDIDSVAVVGRNLFFQGSPSEDTELTLYFYGKPDILILGTDEPVCIPEEKQIPILVSYAIAELFEDLEDGIEGATPNRDYYRGKFELGVLDLERETREGVSNLQPFTTGCDI